MLHVFSLCEQFHEYLQFWVRGTHFQSLFFCFEYFRNWWYAFVPSFGRCVLDGFDVVVLACGACGTLAIRYAPDDQCVDRD